MIPLLRMARGQIGMVFLAASLPGCFPSFADLGSGSQAHDAALDEQVASAPDAADEAVDDAAAEAADDAAAEAAMVVVSCEASIDCVMPSVCGSGRCGGLVATYYDNADFTGRNFIRTDATVDFNWGNKSPDPRIVADHYSVRWTGHLLPRYSETHTFHATADDGVILYINDAKVIDHWPPHQAVEDQGTVSLVAGTSYDIKVEYHNDNNEGLISLAWSSLSQPKRSFQRANFRRESAEGAATVGS